MILAVGGEPREFHGQITDKSMLVGDMPNLARVVGYTNAPWPLKSDMGGEYLCRLLKHMDQNGHRVATSRDLEACSGGVGVRGTRQSGYVCRAKDILPRQGSSQWRQVVIRYEKDSNALLEDPIDDNIVHFTTR